MSRVKYNYLFLLLLALFSCKKDVVSPEELVEVSKWEKVAGNYKVYDTLGVFLHDMSIVHIENTFDEAIDSLRFENFNNQFTITSKQSIFSNYPDYITIGYHDTVYDSNNNRWKIMSTLYEDYNNFRDDTLPMRFEVTNINYYIEDLVPYHGEEYFQIAIKQN